MNWSADNILLDNNGNLKLGDFGLSKEKVEGKLMTNRVQTLWYKAPEIILGSQSYNEKIDIWGIGCLLAELLIGSPLFAGTHFLPN